MTEEKGCKKIAYDSRSSADKAINQLSQIPSTNRFKIGKKPTRSYKCSDCGCWHITSMTSKMHKRVDTPQKRERFNARGKVFRQERKITKEAEYWCKRLGVEFE